MSGVARKRCTCDVPVLRRSLDTCDDGLPMGLDENKHWKQVTRLVVMDCRWGLMRTNTGNS